MGVGRTPILGTEMSKFGILLTLLKPLLCLTDRRHWASDMSDTFSLPQFPFMG